MELSPSFDNSSENHDQSELFSHHSVNFNCSQKNLEDIPCPDEIPHPCNGPNVTMILSSAECELPPLPPETPSTKSCLSHKSPDFLTLSACTANNFILPAQIPLPQNSNYQNVNIGGSQMTPPLPRCPNSLIESNSPIIKKHDEQEGGLDGNNFVDNAKYSPSKIDSDDENQDFITAKPKVLGKEQAKKRLMAFSLSKQTTTTVKKNNKILATTKSIKEKPPNPNKGSGVQEQFRATISEIEEEKKKMMQNMPNYLLLEMSDLAKSTHPIITSSLKLLEKHKSEATEETSTKNTNKKESSILSKSNDQQNQKSKESSRKSSYRSSSRSRNYRKSRSRSRSRKRSRSRSQKRSRSRSQKRSRSRSQKRNRRRSRDSSKTRRKSRTKSPTRRDKEDKHIKDGNKDNNCPSKTKVIYEDWKTFKNSGLVEEHDISSSRVQSEESQKVTDRSHKRSQSPNFDRWSYKPIYNYLKKESKLMTTFQAKPAGSGSSAPVLYPEKKIKYTRSKPMIIWSENPSCGTEFYMSKQMLLENCDSTTASILRKIMDSEKTVGSSSLDDSPVTKMSKSRLWYTSLGFLQSEVTNRYDELEIDPPQELERSTFKINDTALSSGASEESKIDKFKNADENRKGLSDKKADDKKGSFVNGGGAKERRMNLVNDSYLSDEESNATKEMVVGDIKVQLDIGLNCVKVRSRWDSDYEGDNNDKERPACREVEAAKVTMKEERHDAKYAEKEKKLSLENITDQNVEKRVSNLGTPYEINSTNDNIRLQMHSTNTRGNLASEYEEFLKMVSFDSNLSQTDATQEKNSDPNSKSEKQKISKTEKSNSEVQKPNFDMTDWDKESDHEDRKATKLNYKKDASDEHLLLLKDEKASAIKKRIKKGTSQKKKGTKVIKKQKLSKKNSKAKRKKFDSSSSSDSSSDSYDSASDSDSDESTSSKKKKRKFSKSKKKYKKDSSSSVSDSDSGSDSDESKSRKKKTKKKKDKKKRKKSESSDSEDEKQNVLLQQLDFKKQLIMKKIEEIDSISERSGKKKGKEGKQKKKEKENSEDTDALEKYIKSMKRRKTELKSEKSKKKEKVNSKTGKETRKKSTSSGSDNEDAKPKKRKEKAGVKKKPKVSDSSDDSDSKTSKDNKVQNKADKFSGIKSLKSIERSFKKAKKLKSEKKKHYSSESESDDSSSKDTKFKKKGRKSRSNESITDAKENWNDNFLLEDTYRPDEKRVEFDGKVNWKQTTSTTAKKVKEKCVEADDWEASSSPEESSADSQTRESWDDDVPSGSTNIEVPTNKNLERNEKRKSVESDACVKPALHSLKASLSNFSFNENSFCSFGQELSRDFFLTERSMSNSEAVNEASKLEPCSIESRPFQSVSQSSEALKASKSELYSPGHSDSELSDLDESSKREKTSGNSSTHKGSKEEVYDPLNSGSDSSSETDRLELGTIPLPHLSDILLPGESRNLKDGKPDDKVKSISNDGERRSISNFTNNHSRKSGFTSTEFSAFDVEISPSIAPLKDSAVLVSTKKQVISMKSQQKLMSKAASVFQDESDEELVDSTDKAKVSGLGANDDMDKENQNVERPDNKANDLKRRESEVKEKVKRESRRHSKGAEASRGRSRDRSEEKKRKKRRSGSRERRSSRKASRERSPSKRRRSRTPEKVQTNSNKERREIRSDSFEIEPLKSVTDLKDLDETVKPIPVLTGLGMASSDKNWNNFPGYAATTAERLTDLSESFDIYPSEDPKYRNHHVDSISGDRLEDSTEKSSSDKFTSKEIKRKDRRHSRSRSTSPKRRRKSKSPEKRKSPRNRSPRRRSCSPKRREKSPYSPKRRSPKRRYKSSRSPDRRRKSRSRSPRKRRGSPRRSHTLSPRKQRSPKRRDSPRRRPSPLRGYSPRMSISPRRDNHYYSNYHNLIPVIGAANETLDRELSPSKMQSPMGFAHMSESALNESEMGNSFYNREYPGDFPGMSYPEEVGGNNLITVKSHDLEKPNSPERLSLDQRIELELGVPMGVSGQGHNDQYQGCKSFQDMQNSYEGGTPSGDTFYQTQNLPMNSDFNSQYYNGHQPQTGYGPFQQYPNSQPVQNSVLQVGNIVEVVPTMQHSLQPTATSAKSSHQIMQVGNVLQVVPSQKTSQTSPMPFSAAHNYGPPTSASPVAPVKTQKATAVVAPSSIVPTQNPEVVMNPLIKAIQLEREKRKKEKEKRKLEREARRKARQLKREAKLMSVNEKLKKSVQDEGLMLGQEVEDDELLDGIDLPSPPIPVEIITVSSPSALPPAGKGILITAGFMPKPPSEKKEVKFADGVCPGEGTSSSGEEDIVSSPPPKPKLPKEKRFKKKKTKVKKKVKVQIIRQIIQDDDDDEFDDLSPPPPPPGDPPPVYFARFPFAGDAQFPVYQTQTTTNTLTTVQYPAQTF